jgi:hypothetical protein
MSKGTFCHWEVKIIATWIELFNPEFKGRLCMTDPFPVFRVLKKEKPPKAL